LEGLFKVYEIIYDFGFGPLRIQLKRKNQYYYLQHLNINKLVQVNRGIKHIDQTHLKQPEQESSRYLLYELTLEGEVLVMLYYQN